MITKLTGPGAAACGAGGVRVPDGAALTRPGCRRTGLRQAEGEGYAVEGVLALAVALLRQCGDRGEDEVAQAGDVAPELREHLLLGDAFPLRDTCVRGGDQRPGGVAEGEFPGQHPLG